MAKTTWKKFIKTNKSPLGFIALVSPTLPKEIIFDKEHNKLPTPYALFLEWASLNLTGAWASSKIPGGFIICVSEQVDITTIKIKFGTFGNIESTPACAKTQQMNYTNRSYGKLAQELGYKL